MGKRIGNWVEGFKYQCVLHAVGILDPCLCERPELIQLLQPQKRPDETVDQREPVKTERIDRV